MIDRRTRERGPVVLFMHLPETWKASGGAMLSNLKANRFRLLFWIYGAAELYAFGSE